MRSRYDVIVIGGGAAGVMAAIEASSAGKTTLLLERMEKCGRKIRITGKGRCNITNTDDNFTQKICSGAEFLSEALSRFSPQDCISRLEKIGVPVTIERGNRAFPTSGKAWDVADALVRHAQRSGTEILYNSRVKDILVSDGRATGIELEGGKRIDGSTVILATGGKSYPRTGSSGDGYYMAHDTGHKIEPLRPSLVSLGIDSKRLKQLTGLKLKNVTLSLIVDGEVIDSRFGELEFFGYGIGGAITMQISRGAVDAMIDGKSCEVALDLKPALSTQKLLGRIAREQEQGRMSCEQILRKLLPSAMVAEVADRAAISVKSPCSDKAAEAIVSAVKSLRYRLTDYGSYDEAIVTAGGISLNDIDPMTMESKSVKGLYFAGELIDIDALTGGYNLQLAFSTGYLAGRSASLIEAEV